MRILLRSSILLSVGFWLGCSSSTPPGANPETGGSGGSLPGSGGGDAVGGTPGVGGAASGGASSGGSASGGAGTGGGDATRTELFRATFEGQAVGTYEESMVPTDFGAAPPWNNGLDDGRATIVEEAGGKFLRVTYPAGLFGPANAGVQFQIPFSTSHEELYFAYRVRFSTGFDFVKGGKLPGLVGGTSPTGCNPNEDGFSARNMWRTGGAAVQYVYWPEQPNTCGDDLRYDDGPSPKSFTPGVWQTVEHRVRMNTPGVADGVMQAWVDGELALSDEARLWRKEGATFSIDTLYFSTFFGGGDASWAPATAQVADFDDLVVADKPITH